MATENSALSFARDILPLFRESDRDEMKFAFDLWDYNDVCTHAQDILERLARWLNALRRRVARGADHQI